MLDPRQLAAVDDCCNLKHRVVAVTGPAGSGKTTVIKEICARLEAAGVRFAVAAPTGKAARRVKEATGYEALTIHRLLEYTKPGEIDPDTGEAFIESMPRRGRDNPLPHEVVIVDEYTMVSTALHRNLVDALKPGACIRAFGDLAQLPPIEDKSLAPEFQKQTPFMRLLERKTHEFDFVYRQGEGSHLLAAANKIRRGVTPSRSDEFMFTFTDKPIDKLIECVLDGKHDFKLITNQIITPMRKSWIGTLALNSTLQALLNPESELGIELPRHEWDEKEIKNLKRPVRFAVGDKVVCTENTYELRDFEERYGYINPNGIPDPTSYIHTPDNKQMLNGEVGILTVIRPDESLEIDFGDRIVEVPANFTERMRDGRMIRIDPRKRIDLAYALTTHKTQGSEFKNVIYVMNKSAFYMASRKNFYTAITRARETAHVITDQKTWSRSMGNVG